MHAICHSPQITLCHLLFFLDYVTYLELRLVLELYCCCVPDSQTGEFWEFGG